MIVETYPEEGGYNCRKWTWAIFDDSGKKELARGEAEGSLRHVESVAKAERQRLFLQQKRTK